MPINAEPPPTNLFAGVPDERQMDKPTLAPEHTLFRARYRKLEPHEVELHDRIKAKADELAGLFVEAYSQKRGPDETVVHLPNGMGMEIKNVHHFNLAISHLEDSVYRIVKLLTS